MKMNLVKIFFQKYYDQSGKPLVYTNPYISSHWYRLKQRFYVEKDNSGNITGVGSAGGFGNMLHKSHFVKYALEQLLYRYWFFKLPYKRQIVNFYKKARKISQKMGIYFNYENFRHILTLSVIDKYMPESMKKKRINFLMIGDGYGFLSALAKSVIPNSRLFLVDLGETLIFQSYYVQKAHPDNSHIGIFQSNVDDNLLNYDFIYCPTEYLDVLSGINFDICVNTASMQEMNTDTIQRYFSFMRWNVSTDNLFYCLNREHKQLCGGEVSEFDKYPWSLDDKHVFYENCPWLKFFIQRTVEKGPKFLGITIPFLELTAVHKHALTVLATEKK